MKIFALADLHLGNQVGKSMHKFGPKWENHEQRIADNLAKVATDEDILLLAGDLSWALHLSEAEKDMRYIASLPGRKILLRGNHDYWWTTISKVQHALQNWGLAEQIFLLQNNAIRISAQGELSGIGTGFTSNKQTAQAKRNSLKEKRVNDACVADTNPASTATKPGIVIAGTRGWKRPDDNSWKQSEDLRILNREEQRLTSSLELARALKQPGDLLVAMLHYPPFGKNLLPTSYTNLLSDYGVKRCVFGHIHSPGPQVVHNLALNGVNYDIVACDQVNCEPLLLYDSCAP